MIRNSILCVAISLAALCTIQAQDEMTPEAPIRTSQTFNDNRLVHSASVEMLEKGKMELRLNQLFGAMKDFNNIGETFFGLEKTSDISIGAAYGLSENINVGLFRAKGGGFMSDGAKGMRQLLNGSVKYRVLRQVEGKGMPVTVTLSGLVTLATEKKVENETTAIHSYPKFSHRLAYHGQIMVARKFSDRFSIQASGAYTYRNLVPSDDVQGIYSAGLGARYQVAPWLGLVGDVVVPISQSRTPELGYYPVYGLGFEFKTGCNIFQINLSNASGIAETDYLPYNTGNWSEGDFRLGFSLSRTFGFKTKKTDTN